MLSYEEFAKQDFFKIENHFEKFKHIKSTLIFGDPCYKKISIVIPTYKRAHLLEEALHSCLEKSSEDLNIVIADNNPERNDETEHLIKQLDDPRIVYYKNEENIGPLANFNRCIELSDCTYCIFLCSDDLLDEAYVDSVIKYIGSRTDIDMLLPQKYMLYPKHTYKMKGYSLFLRNFTKIFGKQMFVKLKPSDFLLYYPAGGPSGILYKRSAFFESGGFNPLWHPTGDYILHFLMSIRNNVYLTSLKSGDYRMLENISQEKGMSSIYIIHNYLIRRSFAKTSKGHFWAGPCFKGSVFRWLKLNIFEKTNDVYDVREIKKYIKNYNIFHLIFSIIVWSVALLLLLFRIRLWRAE